MSTLRSKDIQICQDPVTKLLLDVPLIKRKEESMNSKLLMMKHELETPW
jgi:heat shock transcription factor 1